jgi:hypothetical protein
MKARVMARWPSSLTTVLYDVWPAKGASCIVDSSVAYSSVLYRVPHCELRDQATYANSNVTFFSYSCLYLSKPCLKRPIPRHPLLRALTTSLILHTNLHRRLGELLLRLALAVHLILLACRMTTNILCSVPCMNVSAVLLVATYRRLSQSLLSCLLAVRGLHVQLVLFASGVRRVGVLACGLAAGLS